MFWKTRNYLTQKVSLPLLTHNIGKQYLWNIRMRDFIFYTYLVMIFYTILDWYWEGGGQNWTRNSNCGGGPIFFIQYFFFNCRPECPQLVESQLVLPVFHRILHPETKKVFFYKFQKSLELKYSAWLIFASSIHKSFYLIFNQIFLSYFWKIHWYVMIWKYIDMLWYENSRKLLLKS